MTLLEKVRYMLSNSGLGKQFWVEALSFATFLVNRFPCSGGKNKTRTEVWSGSHTNYDGIYIFGCPTYYHVYDEKLDPRALKALFLHMSDMVKGFKLWYVEDKNIVISMDVTFDRALTSKALRAQRGMICRIGALLIMVWSTRL